MRFVAYIRIFFDVENFFVLYCGGKWEKVYTFTL